MAKMELAICCKDEPEAHRKKQGDIIAVEAYPHEWSAKELKEYLIVIVDVSEKDMAGYPEDLKTPLIKDGAIIKKRKYYMSLDTIKENFISDLSITKVEDTKIIYQPFKSQTQICTSLSLAAKDVDCASVDAAADREYIAKTLPISTKIEGA